MRWKLSPLWKMLEGNWKSSLIEVLSSHIPRCRGGLICFLYELSGSTSTAAKTWTLQIWLRFQQHIYSRAPHVRMMDAMFCCAQKQGIILKSLFQVSSKRSRVQLGRVLRQCRRNSSLSTPGNEGVYKRRNCCFHERGRLMRTPHDRI